MKPDLRRVRLGQNHFPAEGDVRRNVMVAVDFLLHLIDREPAQSASLIEEHDTLSGPGSGDTSRSEEVLRRGGIVVVRGD